MDYVIPAVAGGAFVFVTESYGVNKMGRRAFRLDKDSIPIFAGVGIAGAAGAWYFYDIAGVIGFGLGYATPFAFNPLLKFIYPGR